jgi:hypothetical protein
MRPLLYFLETINVNGKNYLFSFREIAVSKGQKFCIMTFRDQTPIVFEMIVDKNNNWRISPPAPDWIFSMQANLLEILKSRLAPG